MIIYCPVIRFTTNVRLVPIQSSFNMLSHIQIKLIDDYMRIQEGLEKVGIYSPVFIMSSKSIWDAITNSGKIGSIVSTSFENNQFVYGKYNADVELPENVSIQVYSGGHLVGALSNSSFELIDDGVIFRPNAHYKNLKAVEIVRYSLHIDLIDTLNMLSVYDTQKVASLISKYSRTNSGPEITLDEFYKIHQVHENKFSSLSEHMGKEIHKQVNGANKRASEESQNLNSTKYENVDIYRCTLTDAISSYTGDKIAYLKFDNDMSNTKYQIPIYFGNITDSDQILAIIVVDGHSPHKISDILVSASTDEMIINICKMQ